MGCERLCERVLLSVCVCMLERQREHSLQEMRTCAHDDQGLGMPQEHGVQFCDELAAGCGDWHLEASE